MAIEDVLATWLGDQRWFAGKGQGLHDLAIVADTELVAGEPELRHLIVAVSHGTAVDYYQILVGLRRRLPVRLQHVRIGPSGDGRIAYDALHDADLTKPLLAGIAAGSEGRAAADARRSPAPASRPGSTAWCSAASRATPALSSATSRYSRCSAGSRPVPTRTSR